MKVILCVPGKECPLNYHVTAKVTVNGDTYFLNFSKDVSNAQILNLIPAVLRKNQKERVKK
jgi:hypothetical protein